MHSARKIATNSLMYTSALILQRAISTIYFWYYSNHLPGGAADLGRLQYVLSFVVLFFIIGDLGLYLVFLRESSKQTTNIQTYLNTLLLLKLPLILLASILIVVFGSISTKTELSLLLLALAWITVDNVTMLFFAAIRAHQNLVYESAAVVVYQIVVMIIGVTSIQLSGNVVYLIMALLIASLLELAFVTALLIKRFKFKFTFAYDRGVARFFLKSLPAFAVAGILIKILNTVDTVLIKELSSNYQNVGLYSIPLKLINALSLTLPTALMGALYPAFSHFYKESRETLNLVFEKSLSYLLIVSLPITLGFLSLGDEFIQALWKDEYIAAIGPGKIMLCALPFIFLAFPTGNLLNATSRQRFTAMSRGIGVFFLFVCNLILIPAIGLYGAAITLVITHAAIFVSDVFFLRDQLTAIIKPLGVQLIKVAIAAAVMFASVTIFSSFAPWYLVMILGGGSYFVVLFCIGGLNLSFLRHIKSSVP